MNNSIEEKRAERRYPIDATVQLTSESRDNSFYGICQNISASGMLIRTTKPLSPQDQLTLKIFEGGKHINGSAEVVHSREDGQSFLIGLKACYEGTL